jgi:glycine cleavage system pyridoxal-binding protein P
MNYVPHTADETKEMLRTIGVLNISDLFSDIKPELKARSFNLPEGKCEFEVMEHFKKLSAKNATNLINFVGAGFYDHYIPPLLMLLPAGLSSTPHIHLTSRNVHRDGFRPFMNIRRLFAN